MIIQTFLNLLSAYRGMTNFVSLDQSKRKIVFYSEDTHSIVHFEEIIRCLVEQHGEEVCYLTSDLDDPVLKNHHQKVKPFYVGHGLVRNILFLKMHADLLIMTMPDLETYYLKRSKAYPVHYLYMFHAMVSTHSIYRKGAFDNFDTIFCTGPYHVREIRETEKTYGLPEKELIEVDSKYYETEKKSDEDLSQAVEKLNKEQKSVEIIIDLIGGENLKKNILKLNEIKKQLDIAKNSLEQQKLDEETIDIKLSLPFI